MSTKVKKQLMLLTLMLLVFGLWAYNETKVFKSIDETAKMIAPEQHLIKTLNFKGEIINYAYAKDTGNLVVIEELNHQYRMVFYDKELNLLWEKNLKHIYSAVEISISDNGNILVLHRFTDNSNDENGEWEVFVEISTWDNKGNILNEIKVNQTYFGLSPSGNYLTMVFLNTEDYNSKDFTYKNDITNFVIYDKYLKNIKITGFINDNNLVSGKVISDSLVICLKKNKDKELYTFEFYNFKNNHLSLKNIFTIQNPSFDVVNYFFQDNSFLQVNDYLIERSSQTIFDLNGDIVKKYSKPFIGIFNHDFQDYSIDNLEDCKNMKEKRNKNVDFSTFVGDGNVNFKNGNLIQTTQKYYCHEDHENYIYDLYGNRFIIDFDILLSDSFKRTFLINKKTIKVFGE